MDEALEEYAAKLAWHVRRTWDGLVEVLIKKRGDYSEIDILEATEDAKKALLSIFILQLASDQLNLEISAELMLSRIKSSQ